LCFDAEGRIFVADTYNRRVQAFQLLSTTKSSSTTNR
jgi:sugar lactone lactonase YvrE